MGATKEIAEFVYANKYSDFDSDVIKHTKDLCLNGIGMAFAGVNLPTSQAVINYVREAGTPPEAGVIGAGFRSSAEFAALANGMSSHATEWEDVGSPEVIYMVGIFPTAFAMGEKVGLSGKEVIQLTIIGYEVASNLSLNCVEAAKRGFQLASTFCCIGTSAMAAKALGLGVDKTIMAMSLAASQACGLQGQTATGAHLYESGICGRNGISAALLAKRGLTGRTDIFETPNGFCDAVAGTTELHLQLGGWRIKNAGSKSYPCCFLEQNVISTVLELIREHNIRAEDVDGVQLDIYPKLTRAVRYFHPTNAEEARFSFPHSIAAAFLEEKVSLDSFTEEKARDPRFHAFRDKVEMVVHPDWGSGISRPGVPITIKLKDGVEYKKVSAAMIAPKFFSDKEIMDNFINRAAPILSYSQAKQVAEMVLALDEAKDISSLMEVITFPKKA